MVEKEFIEVSSYSGEQRLFRYVEVEKLLFMIAKNALPLTRMTLFDDPFEGSYPKKFLEIERALEVRAQMQSFGKKLLPVEYREDPERYLEKSRRKAYEHRMNSFLSCWHANDSESAAMWRLYSNYHKGIAIQTELDTLIRELPSRYDHKGANESPVHIAEAQYIDFDNPDTTEYRPSVSIVKQWQWKRKAFSAEKEVRVHVWVPCGYGDGKGPPIPEVEGDYILLSVDLGRVIQRIIIAPESPGWYRELVASVIQKYGFEFQIVDSALAAEPKYMFWADIGMIDV
jgi:hypothetical protein